MAVEYFTVACESGDPSTEPLYSFSEVIAYLNKRYKSQDYRRGVTIDTGSWNFMNLLKVSRVKSFSFEEPCTISIHMGMSFEGSYMSTAKSFTEAFAYMYNQLVLERDLYGYYHMCCCVNSKAVLSFCIRPYREEGWRLHHE